MPASAPSAAIDVLLPVYNGADTIEGAVASMQAQTVRDIRIVIVNDGSTDGTGEIVRRIAAADARVLLAEQDNTGLVGALNAGLALCDAPLVARFDADDLADPDRLARQVAYLEANHDCVAVSGAVRHIDQAGRVVRARFDFPDPALANPDECPQVEPYLCHPFLTARRAALEQVGGYRHAFLAEDTDLYWRLAEIGRLFNMADILGSYRISTGSVTGASLNSGRLSALNSQLAGLSARRRRAGRPDLAFPESALAEQRAAGSLEALVRVGARQLDAAEAQALAACTCAKLLELSSYRPYELDARDCAFIRRTLVAALPGMSTASRANCRRMMSGTAARLAASGRLAAAWRLAPPGLYPTVAARAALRLVLPDGARRIMLRALGRPAFAK